MDNGLIIAVVGTAIANVGVVISMMFWARNESNDLRKEAKQDRGDFIILYRQSEKELIEHRKEMNQISRNIENETRDFHFKLLEIERTRLKPAK